MLCFKICHQLCGGDFLLTSQRQLESPSRRALDSNILVSVNEEQRDESAQEDSTALSLNQPH